MSLHPIFGALATIMTNRIRTSLSALFDFACYIWSRSKLEHGHKLVCIFLTLYNSRQGIQSRPSVPPRDTCFAMNGFPCFFQFPCFPLFSFGEGTSGDVNFRGKAGLADGISGRVTGSDGTNVLTGIASLTRRVNKNLWGRKWRTASGEVYSLLFLSSFAFAFFLCYEASNDRPRVAWWKGRSACVSINSWLPVRGGQWKGRQGPQGHFLVFRLEWLHNFPHSNLIIASNQT
jgi:hypothetical protein